MSVLDDSIRLALVRKGRFICQPFVDNRGDVPGTDGLQESLEWPISPQWQMNKGEVAYNTISGPPGGSFPASLRDAVLNFSSQIAPHIDGWLTAWGMPSGFDGWVHDDIEKWDTWAMTTYNSPTEYTNCATTYPWRTYHELFAEFRKLLHAKIREVRPTIRGISVYGMGGVNPNYMQWHWSEADAPNYRNRSEYLRQAEKYGRLLRSEALGGTKESAAMPTVPAFPFYDTYWSQGWTREERKEILLRAHEVYQAVFGKQFYRYAFVYLPLRSQQTGRGAIPMTISELREIWTDALALGYRHFGFWGALESTTARDVTQGVINDVVGPLTVELGGRVDGYAVQSSGSHYPVAI